ncbi:MAG: MBL fold metallo-hydrolase [Bacteroidota bacterium]|nr:MBL fold metallo-hydrolase [Bacteroidota bacterium]
MDLFVTALNSGSNGNCYYIGNEEEAVLVDVGISCREVERRMARLNLRMDKLKAIFVSHEHSDHCRGIPVLSKKYKLPIFINMGTLQKTYISPESPLLNILKPNEPVTIGSLTITAFPKFHDANDPLSFVIKYNDICVGVFTDIGMACPHVIKHFKCCHAVFLEANYDSNMLVTGKYPYHLKVRINSDKGHLSNQQALDLFLGHRPIFMSHLFLSHISKENNDLKLVHELFNSYANGVEVVLTSRNQEIGVYKISKDHALKSSEKLLMGKGINKYHNNLGQQLGLPFL